MNFEQQLKQLDRYRKMPQMIPWVGSQYGKHFKKVLLIGESHYLEYSSRIQNRVTTWYESSVEDLTSSEVSMTSTAKIVQKNYAHNTIWANPARIIRDVFPNLIRETVNVYDHFAFYNFFQRPAEKQGKGIKHGKQDREIANDVCSQIINILEPDAIIFLSSTAHYACDKGQIPSDVIVDYAPHPARFWWNKVAKKYGNKSGRDKFKWILENRIK